MVRGGLEYKVGMEKGGRDMNMKGNVYIANAFSVNMLSKTPATVYVEEINLNDLRSLIKEEFVSAIGHQGTSEILSAILEKKVEVNRINIELKEEDTLIAVIIPFRLEEGRILSKEELEKLPLKFLKIKVQYKM